MTWRWRHLRPKVNFSCPPGQRPSRRAVRRHAGQRTRGVRALQRDGQDGPVRAGRENRGRPAARRAGPRVGDSRIHGDDRRWGARGIRQGAGGAVHRPGEGACPDQDPGRRDQGSQKGGLPSKGAGTAGPPGAGTPPRAAGSSAPGSARAGPGRGAEIPLQGRASAGSRGPPVSPGTTGRPARCGLPQGCAGGAAGRTCCPTGLSGRGSTKYRSWARGSPA